VVGTIGLGALSLLAWKGVRCFIRARQLLRWRRPSLKGLDDQLAALRGEVRVNRPLDLKGVGPCLWHRRIVKAQTGGKHTQSVTVSDISKMAEFSIVIEEREYVVKDPPTHVYGAHQQWTRSFMTYWLPVVDYLTVLGRVRQKESRGQIVSDPKVGLVFSTHPAEHTALRELVKGGVVMTIVVAGLLTLYFVLAGAR
jgi:hypothetical protein